jgi:hypothetical protein
MNEVRLWSISGSVPSMTLFLKVTNMLICHIILGTIYIFKIFFFIVGLDRGTLWHLHMFLQNQIYQVQSLGMIPTYDFCQHHPKFYIIPVESLYL